MRVDGWEKRLDAVVEKHRLLPSRYGISDCYLIADDGVKAVTGKYMFPNARRYSTEIGAARQLRKHGFKCLTDAFASKFEPVAPLMAQRGDIGLIERGGILSAGVFLSIGFMTRGIHTVEFVRATEVSEAFRVI